MRAVPRATRPDAPKTGRPPGSGGERRARSVGSDGGDRSSAPTGGARPPKTSPRASGPTRWFRRSHPGGGSSIASPGDELDEPAAPSAKGPGGRRKRDPPIAAGPVGGPVAGSGCDPHRHGGTRPEPPGLPPHGPGRSGVRRGRRKRTRPIATGQEPIARTTRPERTRCVVGVTIARPNAMAPTRTQPGPTDGPTESSRDGPSRLTGAETRFGADRGAGIEAGRSTRRGRTAAVAPGLAGEKPRAGAISRRCRCPEPLSPSAQPFRPGPVLVTAVRPRVSSPGRAPNGGPNR